MTYDLIVITHIHLCIEYWDRIRKAVFGELCPHTDFSKYIRVQYGLREGMEGGSKYGQCPTSNLINAHVTCI